MSLNIIQTNSKLNQIQLVESIDVNMLDKLLASNGILQTKELHLKEKDNNLNY